MLYEIFKVFKPSLFEHSEIEAALQQHFLYITYIIYRRFKDIISEVFSQFSCKQCLYSVLIVHHKF